MKKIILPFILLLLCVTAICQNPLMLKDVYPGVTGSGIQQIVKTTGYTFFNAEDDDADADLGLYRTDGTAAGTIKLNLTYPTYISTKADKLTALGDKIIFAGDNFGGYYGEIWTSDGTQAGTIALERFQPTLTNRGPVFDMAAMGGYVYYAVVANNNKTQIRRTDGTPGGTSLVYEFSSYTTAPEAAVFKVINNVLYFNMYDNYGAGNDMVWRTDGTAVGTYMLRDLGAAYFLMGNFMEPVNGKICFMTGKFDPVNFANSISVLFSTDGTPAGTVPLKEFASTYNNNLYPAFARIGNIQYLSINDGIAGKEFWKTDGTLAGTVLAADINPGAAGSNPVNLSVLNSELYFSATTITEGSELWKFNGTVASLIKDINPGSANSSIGSVVVSGNTLLFRALTASTGSELWVTDGTGVNTLQVADINPGTSNSVPNFLTPGNTVYFSANNGVNGPEIFRFNNPGILSNKLYVNDGSLSGDVFTSAIGNNSNNGSAFAPFATPDYAYSIAQPGDTIYVDAGTYDLGGLTYSFPKPAVFLGTNYLVSPNNGTDKLLPNASRNSESVISNAIFTIASNGLAFKGFTFNMGDHRAIELQNSAGTNNDFGNFIFEKNIHKINAVGNFNQFPLTGKLVSSPALPVTTGYTFTDNRFEKSGSANGTTFNFNYIKNVTIADNAFVVTGTTLKTQLVVNAGATGITDSLYFSNNTIAAASIIVNSNRVANQFISGNKIINCDRGLNVVSTMPESSSIEFTNNNLQNNTGGGGFIGYNRSGTSLSGTTNLFKVEDNTITGVAVPGLAGQLFGSMNFSATNSILNPSFIIRGNKINYSGDFSTIASEFIRPITLRGNVANATLQNNEIILNNTGTLLPNNAASGLPTNPGITINTDFGTGSYMPSNAVINILNNKVQGFKQSVIFYDPTSGINPYIGYGNIPAGAVVNINNNSFTADSISINNGTISQTVNATCNWYGAASAANALAHVSMATVNYFPWLANGTDSDVATGFQPVAGSCNGTAVEAVITQSTNINCNGANTGAVNVTISGGSTPYSFAWSKDNVAGFSNTEDLSSLAAGVYQLIVTDANGSADTVTATITEPAALTASATGTNLSCFGDTNGSATVDASGGTAPYTYLWSNAATTSSISGLVAGNYSVTVTDANGCTTTVNYSVTQPTALTTTISGTNINCFGNLNGTATVNATGGTAPYIYLWSNAAITNSISGLAAGNYSVTITDANGCATTASYTVTQPAALTAVINGTNVGCFGGSNGTATVNATGGTAPYTYLWNNAAITNSISGLAAGNYSVTITDANGCATTASNAVTQPAALTATVNGTNINCFGNSNGTATVNATGGTAPYTYLWSNAATTNSISGLAAGNYSVTVTDANGCTKTAAYLVTQPAILTVVMSSTSANCNGSATATPAGGTAPYTYNWINGGTTQTISGVPAGTYTVVVTDANNCTVTGSRTITGNSPINPAATVINVSCFGGSNGKITVTGAGGTAPRMYGINGSAYQSSNVFANLPAGIYLVAVKDAAGCYDFVSKTITQPTALTVALDSANAACFATDNGRIYITANGGSGGKSYNWTGPNGYTSNMQDPNNLFAGTYNVLVTDANGCTKSLVVIVIERPAINISEVITQVGCRGDLSGAINATVTGGSGSGFTYKWNGPNGFVATTEDINGIKAGNYTFTVTDIANGCAVVKVVIVTQPASNLGLATAKTNVTGCNSLGTITATGSGGTIPYQYKLNNGSYQSPGLFTNVQAGTYMVWIKDANGCTTAKEVSITDSGTDQYEGNNNKNQAKSINIGTTINARIAVANDIDWFKFVTPAGSGSFILSLTHPSTSFTFNMYPAGNNAPALGPVSTTATSKQYLLSGNSTYYISVTDGLSYVCYDMLVAPPVSFTQTVTPEIITIAKESIAVIEIDKPVVTAIAGLFVKAYPNPHQGSFKLQIESPEKGTAKIELFTITGQKLQEKTVSLQKSGNNIVPFTVAQYGTILYRVSMGDKIITGKILSLN